MSAAEEQPREAEPEPEPDGMSEGTAKAVLLVIAAGVMAGIVVAFPYVAYVVVGILGTLAWQKAHSWIAQRRGEPMEGEQEAVPPNIGEALRRLIGDDNGVLLTRLRDDLKVPDTKVVKRLLDESGVTWKAVRTRHGNGPGVHKDDVPAAPSPVAADGHGDGCCCRSGDNANANNGSGEGPGEGIRAEAIGDGGRLVHHRADLESLVDRFFAEAARNRQTGSPSDAQGEVNER